MKKFKKVIALFLTLVLCVSLCVPVFAAGKKKTLNYLVLGDSIANAYGIENSLEAGYGKIVADTNGYIYNNESYGGGETTSSLYYTVMDDYVRRLIKDADIISISIGANDYFLGDSGLNYKRILKESAKLLFLGDDSELDAIEERANINYGRIMDRIYALNPDVTIVAQTFYQSWYGPLGIVYKNVINRANNTVLNYKKEHPDKKYLIADVGAAFEGHKDYVAADTIHPSAKGNLAIAQTVLDTLYDAGLGTSKVPVVNEEGIDYNLWRENYGNIAGFFLGFIVNLATGRLFVF